MPATFSSPLDIKHRRQEIATELGAIAKASELAKRRFTSEERGRINNLREEDKQLKAELENLQGEDEDRRFIAGLGEELGQSAGRVTDTRASDLAEAELKESKKDQGFSGFGQFLQSVATAAIAPHRTDKRLKWVGDKSESLAVASGMSESVPSDGGFLVQFDFITEILRRMYDIGNILSRIRKVEVGTNANGIKIPAIDETSRANGSRWGGVQGFWQAEASTLTASKPKLRLMELDLKKIIGLVYATDELLQDAAALESIIAQALPEELNFVAEDSLFNGTGSGQPLGFFNAPALITVAKQTNQQAATVVFENIQNMWARMYAPSRRNAIWVVDQSVEPQLNAMSIAVGTGGVPVYMPAGSFFSGLTDRPAIGNQGAGAEGTLGGTAGTYQNSGILMGRPVFTYEYGAALGSVGDIALIDPTQYIGITKGGIQSAQSMHVKFLTDEMTYRFTYRFDGQPIWHAALTPKSGSNSWSPYIALAAR